MILTASLGYVLSAEQRLLLQKKQLEEFHLLLSVMEHEICGLRLPLPLVLEHCSGQLMEPYGSFLGQVSHILKEQTQGDAGDVWRRELEKSRRDFCMDDAQFGLLLELGQVLRMDGLGLKEDLFHVYEQRLQSLTKNYEEGLAGRRRIYRYGGILAGIFLIILFI
jgi:stage III sporulation protein AB